MLALFTSLVAVVAWLKVAQATGYSSASIADGCQKVDLGHVVETTPIPGSELSDVSYDEQGLFQVYTQLLRAPGIKTFTTDDRQPPAVQKLPPSHPPSGPGQSSHSGFQPGRPQIWPGGQPKHSGPQPGRSQIDPWPSGWAKPTNITPFGNGWDPIGPVMPQPHSLPPGPVGAPPLAKQPLKSKHFTRSSANNASTHRTTASANNTSLSLDAHCMSEGFFSTWLLAGLAAFFEVTEGVLMKYVCGFRNHKMLVLLTIAAVFNSAISFLLLKSSSLSSSWGLFTQLEFLGVIVSAYWLFEERINFVAWVGIGLAIGGICFLDICNANPGARVSLSLDSQQMALLACISILNMVFSYWAAQTVRWTSRWRVFMLKVFALFAAAILEVVTAALWRSGYFWLGLLSNQACIVNCIVLLEFMDLSSAWCILTGLEFLGVQAVASAFFHEVPTNQNIIANSLIFFSITLLSLPGCSCFPCPAALPPLLPQIKAVRKEIESARVQCTIAGSGNDKVVVLLGAGPVGKLVLKKLCVHDMFVAILVVDSMVPLQPQASSLESSSKDEQGSSSAASSYKSTLIPLHILHDLDGPEPFAQLLSSLDLKGGDLIVDLADHISSSEYVRFCHANGLHYVSASLAAHLEYYIPLHDQIDDFHAAVADCRGSGASSIVFHGMNPGLVTHCVKKAVVDLGRRQGMLNDSDEDPNDLASVVEALGVVSIEITERDTQETVEHRGSSDYVTSRAGEALFTDLMYEAVWWDGQREGVVRSGRAALETTARSVCLGAKGMEEFVGYVTGREEVFTIPKMFPESNLRVRFVYAPSPQMIESVQTAKWLSPDQLAEARNICTLDLDTNPQGSDCVGAYVTTSDGKGQWAGLRCTAAEAWDAVGMGNGTSWLTAWGVLVAIDICLESPWMGVCFPEDVPLDMVLPSLDKSLISVPVDRIAAPVAESEKLDALQKSNEHVESKLFSD